MTTFSQMVDKISGETRRPDMLDNIASYLNQTIREVHADPVTNASINFKSNRTEKQLVVVSETSPLTWDMERPQLFQNMQGVRFDNCWEDGDQVWVTERTPGRGLNRVRYFWYQAGSTLVFSGAGGVGNTVSLIYFEFPRTLKYKPLASRDASYDDEDGWTYLTAATPEDQAAARDRTSNWLLMRWAAVIEEGLRAKVYKRVGDEARARLSYGMYQAQRRLLVTSEVSDLGGYR